MANLTYEKKISDKKYLAYSLILVLSLILIGISITSVKRKQKPSLFFVKVCIGKILPKITDLPKESTAIQGKLHNITCNAESCFGDQTRFVWLDPLQRDLSQMRGFSVKGGLLTISNVSRNSEGEYTCRVVDEYGEDEALVRLEVQVPSRIVQLGNLTREENSSATFECSAEGFPKPNLTIRKDGSEVPFRSGDSRVRLVDYDEGGFKVLQLTISEVKRSDDGLYSCQASNAAGRAAKAGHLEVQFKPDMSPTPARVVKAWSGNPGNLTCIAKANPNASLVWKFRGVQINQWDERYQIVGVQSHSSLLVRTDDYEVFGEYTCEAKNRLGKNSTTIILEEAFTPGPVAEIIFDKVTPTSITFFFLQPVHTGGLPITGYIMRYRMVTDPQERTVDWTKGSTYVLSDLKPRKMYKFSVAARNAAGEGPWLSTGYIMPAEKVPDAPLLVKKNPIIHPDRIRLEWEVPNAKGQPITRYEVRYYKMETCQEPSGETGWQSSAGRDKVFEKTVQTPAVELTGLQPDTCYSIRVRAVNRIGKSPTGRTVLRTSKLDSRKFRRREVLDNTVCGMGLFCLIGFGFLLYRLVSPGTCARFLRPAEMSKAFVISSSDDKRKHGLFRV